MHLTLLLAAALSLPPNVEVLVLRSGATLRVRGAVQLKDNKALFRDPGGAFYSIDAAEIDLEATNRLVSETPDPEPSPTVAPKKLAVEEEEKQRLLKELSKSRGQPAPLKAQPSPSASPSPSATPETDESEDAWRARAAAARERVERSKATLAGLQRYEDELEAFLLMIRGYGDDNLTAQLLELERVRFAIDQEKENVGSAERAWFELQEEARRKDILPGWLR